MSDKKLTMDELANMTAFQCIWENNKHHLKEVAITYKADTNVLNRDKKVPTTFITYEDLFKNIIKTYNSLKNLGVKKGDVISYATVTTPELIYTMYAANILGAIIDVIDPRENADNLLAHFKREPSKIFFAPEKMFDSTRQVYGDIGVEKIVTMSFMESLPRIVKIGSKILDFKNGVKSFKAPEDKIFTNWYEISANSKVELDKKVKFEKGQIVSFAHTTGTTGTPKTIMHTNENWNAQYYNISNSGLVFNRGENFFNVTVPWVDFGIINAIHSFLCNGIRLDLDVLWTPDMNVDFYLKNRPKWWLGAPGWIDPLFTSEKYKDENLDFGRYIVTGGAPLFEHKQTLYNETLKDKNSPCQVVPGYGLSEVTAAAFLDLEDRRGTLGHPMAMFNYRIVDINTLEKVQDGVAGELQLSSKHKELTPMAIGYLNNEEDTNKTFIYDEEGTRWVRTGDKVHQAEDGTVVWESRYKNILTFNGFNINCDKLLDEVEKVKGVGKAAIIGAVTEDGNQRPIVCFELASDYEPDTYDFVSQDIREMIATKFADYYEPLDVVPYDKLPTKTMKINYNKLKEDNLNEFGEYIKYTTLKRGITE